jgi:hypothetical protein
MTEWLRWLPAKQLCFTRVSSNLTSVVAVVAVVVAVRISLQEVYEIYLIKGLVD